MNSSQFINMYLSAFSKNWGLFLVWGIALIVLGLIAISATTMSTIVSVIFLGFLLLICGFVIIIDAFSFWRNKGHGFFMHLIFGILYLLVGIMLIQKPILASVSFTLVLGVFYLVVGVFRFFYSISVRAPQWGWSFFNALISLLLGVLILASWPQSGLFIIGLFVGIDLLFTGWTYVMAALAAKSSLVKSA